MTKDKKKENEIINEEIEDVVEAENADATDMEKVDEAEALKAENLQLKNDCLRAFADVENIKKRCAQEIE